MQIKRILTGLICNYIGFKKKDHQSLSSHCLLQRWVYLDIPCVQNISFIENFCVKTHIFAAKVHFLLDNAKVLREKSKRGRCGGGTQERKIDARKQRKSGKTTVNPSCSSALDNNLYNKKSVILPIASQP